MANYLGTWLPWLIWEKFRFYEVGEINSKDNNDLGWEKSEPAGITSPTISLVRVREQSKYNRYSLLHFWDEASKLSTISNRSYPPSR